jgi:hypothetical protein
MNMKKKNGSTILLALVKIKNKDAPKCALTLEKLRTLLRRAQDKKRSLKADMKVRQTHMLKVV